MASPLSDLLTLERLRTLAGGGAFARGAAYAGEGRVVEVDLQPSVLRCTVHGGEPYRVELQAVDGKLLGTCSCPMGLMGDFCKHQVAAALHLRGAQRPARPPASPEFPTQQALEAFLRARGIGYVARLGADVLLPYFPPQEQPALRYVLGRQALRDLATRAGLERHGYELRHAHAVREQLPALAYRFAHEEAENLERARAQVRFRLQPRVQGPARTLVDALLALRATFPPELAPRPDEAVAPERLRFADALPGFTWEDDRPWIPEREVGYGLAVPTVELRLSADGARTGCSCGASKCMHALAAIDAALGFFERNDAQSAAVVEELSRPSWERALRALETVFEPGAEQGAPEPILAYRLTDHGDGLEVQPYLHKLTRKGTLSAGTRLSASRALATLDRPSNQDVRVLQLLERGFGVAEHGVLDALVGHPRVYLEAAELLPLRVERERVGLVAAERGGGVVLLPAVDGSAIPNALLARINDRDQKRARYLLDPGARRLTVLDVPVEVRRAMEVLARLGNDFPPESHPALVEKLSRLSSRVPVAMPRSVMGEQVPPDYSSVLRLQLQADASVRLELRLKPLPEAAAFTPADGPRDVHVRRAGKPLHARRDFTREQALAEELASALPLAGAEPEATWTYRFGRAEDALALLAATEALPARPAIEWTGQPLRLSGRAAPTSLKVVLERKRDWFGVMGAAKVGSERIDLAVLLDAARRQQRFVRASEHSYVEVTEALRRELERLADHTWQTANGLEVGPAAAEALDDLRDLGAKVDADQGFLDLTARIFAAKELSPKIPRAFKGELRDYQLEGFRWLTRLASWGAGGVLADDMGLGKTVQALALMLDRAKLGPQLVVAPTSVGFNWVEECRRFAPSLEVGLYRESDDRGQSLRELKARDVLVVSYGLLARDAERLSQVKFATVVFDEAQSLKNPGTQRAKAAFKLQGDFRCALSGTPLENHLGELWSVFRAVFPGLLGSWEQFRDRFATPIEKKLDPTAAPALSRVLRPFLLRRTKDQVASELPPRTDIRVPVILSPEEWQLYEDARLSAVSELETPKAKLREQQRRIQILAALTRLRLVASHPRLYDPSSELESSKLRRMMELVEELTLEGHRALVFSQFTSHLALVREVLDARGLGYLYLDGGTPAQERGPLVRRFQEGRVPLFLISLKAGGFGLNLTAADYVIHLDPWWNPAVEDQASDRAHRIGQDRPVTVYRLVSRGTIEEQILALHEAKRELVTGVLDGQDQAGKLSTRDLLALLSQGPNPLDTAESPSKSTH